MRVVPRVEHLVMEGARAPAVDFPRMRSMRPDGRAIGLRQVTPPLLWQRNWLLI